MKIHKYLFILLINSFFIKAQSGNFALAENYFRNNEFEKAAELYKQLVTKSPYNTTYLQKLVTCYQETNQFNVAENLLSDRLKQRPDLVFLNVISGYNYERQQKVNLAKRLYNKAIKSITKNSGYEAIIANLFKDYNKLDLAIKAYKKASEANKNFHFEFQIAQIYGEKGNFDLMFNEYIKYLDYNDKYLNTIKRFTARYLTDDSENKNNILFKKALLRKSASNPKDVWNDLLSWLFIIQKDYGKAFIQRKALYQRDSEKLTAIYDLGEIAFYNKDYIIAGQCFDFTIRESDFPEDKFNALLMNLKIAIAVKDPETDTKFKNVFDTYGLNRNTFSIQVTYADYLTFERNRPEEAKKILETAITFSENKYEEARVKLKLADVLVYQNIFNKALIYFSQVQSGFKNHELGQQARFKVAQTSYFKNDFKWAKSQLKILKGSASQLIANDAADLFLIISDNEPVDNVDTGLASYAKASLLTYQNKNSDAINLLTTLINSYRNQSIEDEALFKQASLFVKTKKYEAAVANYKKIITMDSQGILADDAHYYIAELYANELNDSVKAQKYYQKIIFDYPSSIYLVDARKKFRKIRGDYLVN